MKNTAQNMRKNVLRFSFFLMLLTIQPVMAQEDFPDDVDDEPKAPIDTYIYAGLIVGGFLAIRKLKKAEIL